MEKVWKKYKSLAKLTGSKVNVLTCNVNLECSQYYCTMLGTSGSFWTIGMMGFHAQRVTLFIWCKDSAFTKLFRAWCNTVKDYCIVIIVEQNVVKHSGKHLSYSHWLCHRLATSTEVPCVQHPLWALSASLPAECGHFTRRVSGNGVCVCLCVWLSLLSLGKGWR